MQQLVNDGAMTDDDAMTDAPAHRVPVTHATCAEVQGPFLHGTKAALEPGDELVPGFDSNFQHGRRMNHVYFTTLVGTAAWGAQLAAALAGDGHTGRIYVVQPLGPFEDDPNVTDKKQAGNPTASYRTRLPLRVIEQLRDWPAHSPDAVQGMLDALARLREQNLDVIED